MFMKAVANLLVDEDNDATVSERRRDIVQEAFQQCCLDGQVGEMVLTYFRRAAPDDLYRELLHDQVCLSDNSRPISVDDLPREWRANVRQQRGGWKNSPARQSQFCSRQGAVQKRAERRGHVATTTPTGAAAKGGRDLAVSK
jgi:hypothetical protein